MSRIPTHSIDDAPIASRPILEKILQGAPTKRLLNLHAQMAHSPAVLASYSSLRAATAEHGTFGPRVGAALNLAIAGVAGSDYLIGVLGRVSQMLGWSEEQVVSLRTGTTIRDAKFDALTGLAREATVNSGKVSSEKWDAAKKAGWSEAELAETFAHVGQVIFTAYFLNYAQTEPDV
jgi:hypothetical protein